MASASLNGYIAHLTARGILHSTTIHQKTLAAPRNGIPPSIYCGFDPTANYLHLGNYLQAVTIARAGQFGLRPVYLVGGATGGIGDPSFRKDARALLEKEVLQNNTDAISKALGVFGDRLHSFLDRKGIPSLPPKYMNNIQFHQGLQFLDFLQRYGSAMPMATLLRRESVSKRLTEHDSMSFSEFSYQMIQAADFVELARQEVG